MYKECRIVLQILMGVLGCGKERPFFFFFFLNLIFFKKIFCFVYCHYGFCTLPNFLALKAKAALGNWVTA